MSSEKIRQILDAFEKSMRLWPDPFLSPWVPSEKVLIEFIEKPEILENDLKEQIISSIDCKRAIDSIKFEKDDILKDVFELSDSDDKDFSQSLLKNFFSSDKKTSVPPLKIAEKTIVLPAKGMIFKAKEPFKIFQKGRERSGYTFLPPKVLLLNNGKVMPWGGKNVFRVAVVTPKGLFSSINGLDYNTKDGWTIHLWLTYPLSADQINTQFHLGTVDEIEKIVDLVEKQELSEETCGYYGLDQERLLDIASCLPANADAYLAKYEWIQRYFEDTSPQKITKLASKEYKAAADTGESSRLLMKNDRLEEKLFAAILEDPIYISSETKETESLPTWKISQEDVSIKNGSVFVLKDFRNGKIIGNGVIKNKIAKLEELLAKEIEVPISKGEYLMLEVLTNEM